MKSASAHRETLLMTGTFDPVQKLTIIENDAQSREFRQRLVTDKYHPLVDLEQTKIGPNKSHRH
jgi:hypothetical protein